LFSPDQEFSSHPCSSRKWFHLQGSTIQFAATTNRSTKTLQTAPREANITRYSTNPDLAAMLDFVRWVLRVGFRYPFLSRCSEILFKVNWLVLSNFKQVQSIKLSHYFLTFFLLVHENRNIECLRLLSVPLTGISLLIAAAGGLLYVVIFTEVF